MSCLRLLKTDYFLIAFGAIIGATIRWQLDHSLCTNLVGSGVLGLIYGMKISRKYYLLLAVGFCAALTSFSRWIFDAHTFISSGNYKELFILIVGTYFLGLLLFAFGFLLGQRLFNQSILDS